MPQDFDISCQNCGEIIHLDETLAGPVISRIRSEANETIKKSQEEADAKVLRATMLQAELAEKEGWNTH